MKSLLLLSILFMLRVAGCEKDPIVPEFTGKYIGTFIRSTADGRYKPSKVTVTFSGDKYTGTPETPNYPAICSGTFSLSGQKITAVNECMFTANFDWSYIFNGDYTIEMSGNRLTMTKRYADSSYDQYVLDKQ